MAVPGLRVLRRRLDPRAYAKLIDRGFSRISRVIVHPKYRGIGVGTMLVRETLKLAGTPYVEALAVMARYNPFFEKAGMKRIEYRPRSEELVGRALRELERLGIDPALLGSRRYLREVLSKLGLRDLRRASRIVERIARAKLRSAKTIERIRSLDREAMIETLSRLRAKPEYFIWRNPEIPFSVERFPED